jgi:hypothetical protein
MTVKRKPRYTYTHTFILTSRTVNTHKPYRKKMIQ